MKTLQLFILSVLRVVTFAASTPKVQDADIVGLPVGEPSVIVEWNAALCAYFEKFSDRITPPAQARMFAMMHLAIRDATSALGAVTTDAAKQAQLCLAASAAAQEVVTAAIDPKPKLFSAIHERCRAAVPNPTEAASPVKIGQRAGAAILQRRRTDRWPLLVASDESAAQAGAAILRNQLANVSRPSKESAWAAMTPFGLKRVSQLEPETPFLVCTDGIVLTNDRLKKQNRIGMPADVAPPHSTQHAWRTLALVRWNQAAQSLVRRNPATLREQARVFATLNAALADSLLVGSYWNENYGAGRVDLVREVFAEREATGTAMEGTDFFRLPARAPIRINGYPAHMAVLAGAAESILAKDFGGGEALFVWPDGAGRDVDDLVNAVNPPVSLHTAARECAWAMFADGTASLEGCLSGYEFGLRIADYHQKHPVK